MQCTAKGKRKGGRCGNDAIKGGSVCRMHGGAAPQVRKKAQERLAAMVDPALGVLSYAMSKKSKSLRDAITAAKDVLDRAGHKPTEKHEHGGAVTLKVVYGDDDR